MTVNKDTILFVDFKRNQIDSVKAEAMQEADKSRYLVKIILSPEGKAKLDEIVNQNEKISFLKKELNKEKKEDIQNGTKYQTDSDY